MDQNGLAPQNNLMRRRRLSSRFIDNPTFFLKPDPIGDAADQKNREQSRQSSHRVVAARRYKRITDKTQSQDVGGVTDHPQNMSMEEVPLEHMLSPR